jgi:uncharacterized protein (DUF58 family)
MPETIDHSELLKKVRRIEIRTSHLADDMLAGQYHSAFKGRGMEFEEVRPYQLGDDVRSIDWNVTARTGEPHIKLFREERELTVVLLVDLSASEGFGSTGQRKRDLIAEVAATLAYSAIDNNDKVAMIGFTDRIETSLPARKGPRHVLRVIRELLAANPAGAGTDIRLALDHLRKVVKRRAVVFLLSDFLDDGYQQNLRVSRRRHDIIPVVIEDPREFELPNVGLIELRDAETGRTCLVDTASRAVRKQYAATARAQAEQRDHFFGRLDADAIHLRTDEDFVEPIRRFFHKREVRR